MSYYNREASCFILGDKIIFIRTLSPITLMKYPFVFQQLADSKELYAFSSLFEKGKRSNKLLPNNVIKWTPILSAALLGAIRQEDISLIKDIILYIILSTNRLENRSKSIIRHDVFKVIEHSTSNKVLIDIIYFLKEKLPAQVWNVSNVVINNKIIKGDYQNVTELLSLFGELFNANIVGIGMILKVINDRQSSLDLILSVQNYEEEEYERMLVRAFDIRDKNLADIIFSHHPSYRLKNYYLLRKWQLNEYECLQEIAQSQDI